jgi:hypothetical protein
LRGSMDTLLEFKDSAAFHLENLVLEQSDAS